jgi:hypothetical protein
VSEFVREHSQEGVTEALNQIYGERPSKLDEGLRAMQSMSIGREDWE